MSPADVETLALDNTTRGVQAEISLKDPVTNSGDLPAGIVVSAGRFAIPSTQTTDLVLDGWNLLHRQVENRAQARVTFRNCRFGIDDISTLFATGAGRLLRMYGGSTTVVEDSTFLMPGYFGFTELNCVAIGPESASAVLERVSRCDVFGSGKDPIVTNSPGLIEDVYIDTPTTLGVPRLPWDALTTYEIGDVVVSTDLRYAYESVTSGNIGQSLPSAKTSNANWSNRDPHWDGINPRLNEGATQSFIMRRIFINRSLDSGFLTGPASDLGQVMSIGINDGIRVVTNAGETGNFNGALLEDIIITAADLPNIATPITIQATRNFIEGVQGAVLPSTINGARIGPNASGVFFDADPAHTAIDVDVYNGLPARAAGPAKPL